VKHTSKEMIGLFALFLLVVFLVLFGLWFDNAKAQGRPPDITIADWSGGINSKWSPFLLAPNEMLECNNYMLNLERGSLVLRKGDIKRTDSLDQIFINSTPGVGVLNQTGVVTSVDSFTNLSVDKWRSYNLTVDDTNDVQPTGFWEADTAWLVSDSLTFAVIVQYSKFEATKYTISFPSTSVVFDVDDQVTMGLAGTSGSVDTVSVGAGGITGIYAFYEKPRDKKLLAITPGFGENNARWSTLLSSLTNKYQPEVFLADYISFGETPIWATFGGNVFLALPEQRPIVTNVTNTSRLVPLAPGQSEIVPIRFKGVDSVYWGKANDGATDTSMQRDTTGFGLVGGSSSCCDSVIDNVYDQNGTFRYTTYSRPFFSGAVDTSPDSLVDSLYDRMGYVSHEVTLFDQNALLVNATAQVNDSVETSQADSIIIVFARTKGYQNEIRPDVDSFYWISYLISDDLSILDTFKLIDSIPDDSLGSRDYPFVGAPRGILQADTSFIDSVYDLQDPTSFDRHLTYTAPGMPKFVSRTSAANLDNDWWPLAIDIDSSGQKEHRGWAIMVTVVDTVLLGLFSDSSANLVIPTGFSALLGGDDSTSSMTYNIPKLPIRETNKVRVVWRAEFKLQPAPDSFIFITDTILIVNRDIIKEFVIQREELEGREFVQSFSSDGRFENLTFRESVPGDSTIVQSAFFPVGIIRDPAQTQFIDSLSYESWLGGGIRDNSIEIDNRWTPTDNRMDIVKGFYAFKDNLFAWTDSRLFRSELGDPRFKPFNDILFDPGNGDVIIQVSSIGPNLVVFWSSGLAELFDPVGTLPTKGSPVEGIGCIAAHSLVNFGGTIYFRAKDGIRTITSSPLKNFGVANTVISAKINDKIVDGISDSIATTMVVAVDERDGTIIWSYPSIDTMFVYYPSLSQGGIGPWTTRSGAMNQATHYDTTAVANLIKSSSLLYAKAGDQRIFEMFGSPNSFDSGVGGSYAGRVLTRPLFADWREWKLQRLAIRNTASTRDASILYRNDRLVSLPTIPQLLSLNDSTYQIISIASLEPSSYWSLDFRGGVDIGAGTDTDTLRTFYIWGSHAGEVDTK